MDFIIQNIGWFVGIGLILLFALIGYFADSKEKKEIKENKNNIVDNISENNNEVVNNSNEGFDNNENIFHYSEINNLNVNHANNDLNSSIMVNEESIVNDSLKINDQFKNIEETHMSLEDLEKKNYNDILNTRNVSEYSYVEDNEISEYVNSNIDNLTISDFESDLSSEDSLSNDENVSSLVNDVVHEGSLVSDFSNDNDNINNSLDTYDSIISNGISQSDDLNTVDSSNIDADVPASELFNNEVSLNSSVPELSPDMYNANIPENGVLDLDNDSIDNDIWKF